MELNSIASSSRTGITHVEQEDKTAYTPAASKSPSQIFDVEELPQTLDSSPPWRRRFRKTLHLDNPKIARIIRYIRGPRPKVDLPNPTPFLSGTFQFGPRYYTLALEPTLIRATRRLTSPWLFTILAIGYIIGFAFFSRAQSFLTPADSFIDCTATYWSQDDGCGLNGEECMPFSNSSFDFRCPAQCSSVVLQNPRTIGNIEIDFVPLLVGGGDANGTYRGDSFVCAAAVQAGLISDSTGGCASLQLIGNFTNYLPFSAHGLTSVGFPSTFPLSFQFLTTTSLTHCTDFRNAALAFNIIITALLFLVLRPKPVITYWCLVCIGFWHVTLFSQPRATPPPLDDAFGTFLPTLFVAYAFWRLAFRFTLPAFRNAPIESAVWYLAPYWAGVLTNITTDKIPIDRLVGSDIRSRPGAVTALIIICAIVFVIVVNQVRVIRKTGWLPWYLGWYVVGGLTAMVLALLPGLQFRLHHYILSMALIPGTGFPTRLSAIYQGFLLGMFLNGVAAFGFDSILQTAADLQRDAPLATDVPVFLTNSTTYNASVPLQGQLISWAPLPDASEGWTGFSLLVDDVERYVGSALNYSLASLAAGIPHFFRLAYVSGDSSGGYTMPATLWPNGTWVDPLPGTT